MDRIIIGISMVIVGVACIAFNERWSHWFFERTQRPSYPLVSGLVQQAAYQKFWIIVNRCGLVFWGSVLVIAGVANLFF